MKKSGCIWIVLLLVVSAIGIRLLFFGDKTASAPGGDAKSAAKPPSPVEVTLAVAGGIDAQTAVTGSIMADEQVDLRAETQGRIVWMQLAEGSSVSKGQLLVKLNDADLKAQQKKLNVQLELAKQREKRLAPLRQAGGVSADEYETASNQVKSLEADLDQIKARIQLCEIRAPFSGVLGLRKVSEGSMVNSQDILATLTQRNNLKLQFAVPARYAMSLQQGKTVRFTVEGGNDTFKASVYASEGALDETTRTLMFRARVNGQYANLKPGMYANVMLNAQSASAAVNVPTEALVPVLKGAQVYLVKNGKVKAVDVITGVRGESRVEILKGVNPGDSVIFRGLLGLRPGSAVKPIFRK